MFFLLYMGESRFPGESTSSATSAVVSGIGLEPAAAGEGDFAGEIGDLTGDGDFAKGDGGCARVLIVSRGYSQVRRSQLVAVEIADSGGIASRVCSGLFCQAGGMERGKRQDEGPLFGTTL